MTRHLFCSGAPSWTFAYDGTNTPMIGLATITAWDAQTGGTQITDLLAADGTTPISYVQSADGSGDDQLGQIPAFYGPDDVVQLWLSANDGPRVLATASDLDLMVADTSAAIASFSSDLSTFENTFGEVNGVATLDGDGLIAASQRWDPTMTVSDCVDASVASPATGDVLIYQSGTSKWTNTHDSSWTSLSWASGFQSHSHPGESPSNPRYRVARDGRTVYLRGAVERTDGPELLPTSGGHRTGNSVVVATLPSGVRPSRHQMFSVGSQYINSQSSIRMEIYETTGDVELWASGTHHPTWASIDCIYYLD